MQSLSVCRTEQKFCLLIIIRKRIVTNFALGLPGLGPQPQNRLGQFQWWQDTRTVGLLASAPLRSPGHVPQALDKCPTAFSRSLALASSVLTLQKCHKTPPSCFQCPLGRSCQTLFQKATLTCTLPQNKGRTSGNGFLDKAFSQPERDPTSDIISLRQSSSAADAFDSRCCFHLTLETPKPTPLPDHYSS